MIKIDQITLKGFKNISLNELEFKNFNVIVGPNNSGKSNFFSFFTFIDFIINGSTDSVQRFFEGKFYHRDYMKVFFSNLNTAEGKIEFELKFSNTNLKESYVYNLLLNAKKKDVGMVMGEKRIISESLSYKKINKTGPANSIFKRENEKVSYGSDVIEKNIIKEISPYISVIRILKLLPSIEKGNGYSKVIEILDTLIKSPIYYFSNLELIKEDTSKVFKFHERIVAIDLINEIVTLSKSKSFDLFKQTLKQILKIEDVLVLQMEKPRPKSPSESSTEETDNPHYLIFYRHFNNFKQLDELSDGSRLLIALIAKILTSKSELFLIEEPENSIHPKALVDLMNFMRMFEDETQFIINTHSVPLINAVKPENIIVASCKKEGISEFHRIADLKELYKRLKQSQLNFSDEVFFNPDDPLIN